MSLLTMETEIIIEPTYPICKLFYRIWKTGGIFGGAPRLITREHRPFSHKKPRKKQEKTE